MTGTTRAATAWTCAWMLAATALAAGCSPTPSGANFTSGGTWGLPGSNIGSSDASAKDGSGVKADAGSSDEVNPSDAAQLDEGAQFGDDAQAGDDAQPSEDAIPGDDAIPSDDAAPLEDSGDPADVEDPDADPGSDEDAEGLADVAEIKDTGEDPNNPWYTTPLPDQYVSADTADASGPSDSAGQSLPPICTPLIGSVSVTETVGPGGKLDIVIWIDTSGSMSEEAAWVNQNVIKFMDYLAKKGIDYRVVMFGSGLGLCASGCPTADVKHFLWVQQYVSSTNGPNLISTATQFNKYKAFLRPDATHNIVAISDDNCSMLPATFISTYEKLLKDAGLMPKFIYHSIVSFINAANPAQTGNCPGGASYGSFHIGVSKSTNGSMFQLCQKDWTVLFDDLSKAVAATAKPVCTYKLPVPAGKTVTWKNVKVSHVENQKVAQLKMITGESACAANPDGWFYDDPLKPTTATLCAETCKKLVGGAVLFNFGCPQTQLPGSTP